MSGEHTAGLQAAAAARSADAAVRARRALIELHDGSETISFVSVAARAKVSRQFLYAHTELRAEIERLRGELEPAPARRPPRERASDESVRTRLHAALEENKRLRDGINEIRAELALAHGHLREIELAKHALTQA